MDIKLSIIIPVYNVEKYLKECLDSITCQIKDSVEVILIDDGSTDNSGKICEEYKDKFSFIKLIRQTNGGLAYARNVGLSKACGKYLCFVDSDDYIGKESIEKILDWIDHNNADICFFRALKLFQDGSTEYLDDYIDPNKLTSSKESSLEYLTSLSKFPGSACGKTFSRSYLMENGIHFPKDKRVGEDLPFMMEVLYKAKTYASLPIDFYYYRQDRQGSITSTNTFGEKSISCMKKFIDESIDLLTVDSKPKGINESNLLAYVAYEYSILLWYYHSYSNKKDLKAFLKENKWVLDYSKSKKIKMVDKLVKIFGIDITSNLLNIGMKIRKIRQ